MGKFNFKQFIKDEGLDKNKNKSWIRAGWDGRQEQVDLLDENIERMRKLSNTNFDKFEEARAAVVNLEALIESNKEMVAKSTLIHEQNKELLDENKKINKALEKIAQSIADDHLNLQAKDKRIQELEVELAGK